MKFLVIFSLDRLEKLDLQNDTWWIFDIPLGAIFQKDYKNDDRNNDVVNCILYLNFISSDHNKIS